MLQIEREVILSNVDKNLKIPLLNEYNKKRSKSVAPDTPDVQIAWSEQSSSMVRMICAKQKVRDLIILINIFVIFSTMFLKTIINITHRIITSPKTI